MGAVYDAVHTAIDRHVAIKVLHAKYVTRPEVVRRFLNEARAVNRVEHPSVVQISEASELEDGTVYLVMDFLRGESLMARLKRQGGKLPVYEVVRFARQVAAALAAAHAKGIIHRDLKPDNLMVVQDPEVQGKMRLRILDFGIAKLLEPEPSVQAKSQPLTMENTVLGTPRYMAPEQCRGSSGQDEKSDVYSLGVILYEALAGRPPFTGETPTEVLAKHIYEPPPPLANLAAEIPDVLVGLIMRMLRKEKDERPMMAQIATALTESEMSPEVSMSSISLRGFVVPESQPATDSEAHSEAKLAKSIGELPVSLDYAGGRGEQSSTRLRIPADPADAIAVSSRSNLSLSSSGTLSTIGASAGQYETPLPGRARILMAVLVALVLLLSGSLYWSFSRHGAVIGAPPLPATSPSAQTTPTTVPNPSSPAAPPAAPSDKPHDPEKNSDLGQKEKNSQSQSSTKTKKRSSSRRTNHVPVLN